MDADAVVAASAVAEAELTAVTEADNVGAIKAATLVGDKPAAAGATAVTAVFAAARVTVPATTVEAKPLNVTVPVTGVAVIAARTACTAFWNTALSTVAVVLAEAPAPVALADTAFVTP